MRIVRAYDVWTDLFICVPGSAMTYYDIPSTLVHVLSETLACTAPTVPALGCARTAYTYAQMSKICIYGGKRIRHTIRHLV